jgi:hypothetical protein
MVVMFILSVSIGSGIAWCNSEQVWWSIATADVDIMYAGRMLRIDNRNLPDKACFVKRFIKIGTVIAYVPDNCWKHEIDGVMVFRDNEITKLPFYDRLLCPTSVERVTVVIVAQGLFFRCHKS